jgi:hypothetical protein
MNTAIYTNSTKEDELAALKEEAGHLLNVTAEKDTAISTLEEKYTKEMADRHS